MRPNPLRRGRTSAGGRSRHCGAGRPSIEPGTREPGPGRLDTQDRGLDPLVTSAPNPNVVDRRGTRRGSVRPQARQGRSRADPVRVHGEHLPVGVGAAAAARCGGGRARALGDRGSFGGDAGAAGVARVLDGAGPCRARGRASLAGAHRRACGVGGPDPARCARPPSRRSSSSTPTSRTRTFTIRQAGRIAELDRRFGDRGGGSGAFGVGWRIRRPGLSGSLSGIRGGMCRRCRTIRHERGLWIVSEMDAARGLAGAPLVAAASGDDAGPCRVEAETSVAGARPGGPRMAGTRIARRVPSGMSASGCGRDRPQRRCTPTTYPTRTTWARACIRWRMSRSRVRPTPWCACSARSRRRGEGRRVRGAAHAATPSAPGRGSRSGPPRRR